ncbi:helix-turn-helix transcriptional regulator [Novosphingobium decolorationis]|uniref:Helix-turn-helix transcriptional regulator n=1 Tax=Novosphingobium decolorationis TaxID=2698673 RepID=A0ABX8E4Q5_9SPHN|nr:helix-turn-helix transcriptional regulator [Novosphingobium decolorationis]
MRELNEGGGEEAIGPSLEALESSARASRDPQKNSGPDITRLTCAEIQVLAMLADGHTAKSIAADQGLTVYAVNERLRSARRKTGISSSRELAREVDLQKNRHTEIEVRTPDNFSSSSPRQSRPRSIIMAISVLTAMSVGALALMYDQAETSNQPAEPTYVDPLLGSLVEKQADLPELHQSVRREGRDERWATASEETLRSSYSKIPDLFANGNTVRVICGATLCEVAAQLPKGLTDQEMNLLVEDLQSSLLYDNFAKKGLKPLKVGFGQSFVAYFERKTG